MVLATGDEVDLTVVRRLEPGATAVSVTLAVEPAPPEEEELAEAVALATGADAAVVVVGTTEEIESEGYDRTSLALPGRQDDLVRAVAAASSGTVVVVVNAGSPVELPWRDQVPAILLSWFPGQEFGHALADVLLGRVEPGGRLPTTWPARQADVPVLDTRPVEGRLEYAEGIHVGYRAWARAGTDPAFPFGHGLGYTTWAYEDLEAPATADAGHQVVVRVRLANRGRRPGREVVQAYLSRPGSTVERPALWLAGFAVVRAEPGQAVTAELRLAPGPSSTGRPRPTPGRPSQGPTSSAPAGRSPTVPSPPRSPSARRSTHQPPPADVHSGGARTMPTRRLAVLAALLGLALTFPWPRRWPPRPPTSRPPTTGDAAAAMPPTPGGRSSCCSTPAPGCCRAGSGSTRRAASAPSPATTATPPARRCSTPATTTAA